MATYQAHNGYHAISDGRIGGNSLVFVESVNPGNRTIWYVPSTHPEECASAKAPANWMADGFIDFDLPLSRVDESAINLAGTMIFHAPTVGTYSVWMIPGVDHLD